MDLVPQQIVGECLDAHCHLNQKRLKLLHLLLLHFIIGYERTLSYGKVYIFSELVDIEDITTGEITEGA